MNIKIVETVNAAFSSLLDECSNPRQRTSLERIKAACDYLEANGIPVTPSAIESYCVDHNWDGPKAQSIRNSKDVLKRYVEIRRSGQKLQPRSKALRPEPEIRDESLRAYVQLLKEERNQAVAERARIESGLRSIPGIPVDDLIRGKLGGGQPALTSVTATVSPNVVPPSVLKAIYALFDEVKLGNCGLEVYRDRIRNSATGNVLLEKADVAAFRALTGSSKF